MKSTNKKKYSFKDFEKGLMLAGYITPKDSNEVIEKKMLEEYDKAQKKENQKIYFKRTVLAAEIINELKDEKTFGRVKFQKLIYLCENAVHMKLTDDRYKKFAAGPFDNRFMYSINSKLKKQKWFDVKTIKDGKFSKPKYFELDKKDKYKEYYNRYFLEQDEVIKRIISLFRTQRTNFVELIATIFYSWNEIICNNQEVTNDLIYEKIYSWSEEKQKFSTQDIDNAIEWMENEKLTPQLI